MDDRECVAKRRARNERRFVPPQVLTMFRSCMCAYGKWVYCSKDKQTDEVTN